MGETYLILKNWRNKIVWKIFDIKVSARGNQDDFSVKLFVATFASWQNFQLLDTKRDLKFQHQIYKRLFDEKKNNKNDVIEISKNMEMSLHQRYQFLSYSCFDCLLSTKIRLPRLHSAHNLLKVWTMKNCANKQGDKFWCPKQNSSAKFTDQNTFRVLNYSYGRHNPFAALYFWILQSRRGAI